MNSQNLSIEIVWKDEHMIEVEICVSNDSFSGVSRFYDSNVTYLELASELKGYFSSGKLDVKNSFNKSYELFSLSARCIDQLGHISIDVLLQQSDYAESKVINRVKLNANTDLASIDRFCEELEELGTKQSGLARLSFIAT
jgi:hypothetical protein